MSAYAPRSDRSAKFGPYAVHLEDDGSAGQLRPFEAGERLGGPVRRRRGRALLKLLVLAMLAGGAGWAWLNHQETIEAWSSTLMASVTPLLDRMSAGRPTTLPAPAPQETASLPPLETREAPAVTATPASAIALPSPPESKSPAEPEDDDAAKPVEKLPPVVADPSDPYQVKALAAGLHPGLSRALLARLSDADFRNAETAIRKALAETPDGAVFEYPKKRGADLALFQVKFVRGVTPDCRRYVVMITKDRWLTTAMPMEKCGLRTPPEKQARK
jgi:hypothetical protein